MARTSIGLAVLGAGRIGRVHARNVAAHVAGAHLVGVADIDGPAAQRLVDSCGTGRVDDAQSLLADPAVRGVIIATPTDAHAEAVVGAARAGKHILCEKPISLGLGATRAAIDTAQSAGVILQVGFQRRFDPQFGRAKASIEAGEIGQPRFLRLVGRDHRMPSIAYLRTSGGQFRDQMIHEFDLARWFMAPRKIEEVYATGSALIDSALEDFDDVDTSVAFLRFDDGTLGVVDGSREAIYGYDVRAEIQGSSGMLMIGARRFGDGQVIGPGDATPAVESFIDRFADAYRAEVESFVEAIRDRSVPRVGGQDALEALRIAVAATRSRRENRAVKLAEVIDD